LAPLAEALAAAAERVACVAAGRSLGAGVERQAEPAAPLARAATADLCYGTLRRYGRVQAIVAEFSRRSRAADALVEALLWCAIYALDSGRYAEYTVVDQCVRACALLERARAKPYVNALLRAYLRGRAAFQSRPHPDPVARYWHPRWWIERVRAAYPDAWRHVLEQGNAHPPMCLRVNLRRLTLERYCARLVQAGIAARPVGAAAVLLAKALPVGELPGFAQGEVSVQDAGAQRAAALLDLRAGQRVLDACAAPGGKSAHILESADVELTALEIDAERLALLAGDLARLGLSAELKNADCAATERWWDGRAYQRILADVPCTGSGVARRHPDIKWLRRESDLGAFAARQGRILEALWRVLAPGGKLLYATCSVFPEENAAVVDAFARRAQGVRLLPLPDGAGAQLLPDSGHDGFYFALLEKSA
jgi:16S rRNA (cytosine967-C5)-methyltransferase